MFNEISILRKICSAKFHYTGKFRYGEKSVRLNLLQRHFLTPKIPYGEISLRRNFFTQKLPTADFLTTKFARAKFPKSKFPSAISCAGTESRYSKVVASFGIFHTLGNWFDSQFYIMFKHITVEQKIWVLGIHLLFEDSVLRTKVLRLQMHGDRCFARACEVRCMQYASLKKICFAVSHDSIMYTAFKKTHASV